MSYHICFNIQVDFNKKLDYLIIISVPQEIILYTFGLRLIKHDTRRFEYIQFRYKT